ncbi:dna repair protein : DNA repair protein OS=Photobacterium halotolerans GN=EA58_03470 PE=4 SV=1: 2OG-FeII_Oxy_2 [Gemmata massiliana]|uniref:Fe2OG dioxygenase domain-containing protein n=1 Tax=Gemmata massiliana TaxID=1210884 RepID=A0A6P2CV79_9BACT|nr:alpha-ketoglutarate-dependent dioxygenase AlkB [Gemmata massiliana]VTR91012.1 dna repair protein : DNA repair protein OS=Photobacterium halotolerans GN=EA58_03470 PE=4 SV=1: 2OG-FeII_Oxy_2 [Gemmata massiliana]
MAEWIDIRDGGQFLYDPTFCSPEEADTLFAWLRTSIAWKQEAVRGKPLPRLNAWFADEGLKYSYSGLSHLGTGWLPELEEIRSAVETTSGTTFNSLLLNLYRDGQDSIGFHTDAEPELGENPAVATVSFGSVREFVLKHRKARETLSYQLGHGSLFVMGGTSQHHWLHALPKTEEALGERVSLTFRRIVGTRA